MPKRITSKEAVEVRKLILQGLGPVKVKTLLKIGVGTVYRRNQAAIEFGFETLEDCEKHLARTEPIGLPGVETPEKPADASDQIASENLRLQAEVKDLKGQVRAQQKLQLTDLAVKSFIRGVKADNEPIPAWLPNLRPSSGEGDVDVPMLMVSDLHWAEVVEPTEVMGLNEYNMAIAEQRLRMLAENTEYLFFRHLRPRNWPGIVVNLAGDMLSGDIHPELTESNEAHIMPAFVDLRRKMVSFLTYLADAFGKVFVPCVWGNHTRTTKKIPFKKAAYRSFDWLLYQELADMLKDDDRITFAIASGPELRYTVAGHRYALTHGHGFRGGQGFVGPMAPITRGELKKRLASITQSIEYDTLLMGHWHQTLWRKTVIVNGSLIGYNEMALACDFPFDYPKQMAWLTSGRYGPTSMMEVYCVDVPMGDEEANTTANQITWEGAS